MLAKLGKRHERLYLCDAVDSNHFLRPCAARLHGRVGDCLREEDYFKHQPTEGNTPKPEWLQTGIVSDEGERAVPTNSFAGCDGPRWVGLLDTNR